jgi:DNA-binding CsgD family transcriptional regulator
VTRTESFGSIADRLVDELLRADLEPMAARLFQAASGGDPALLRALLIVGVGLGDLVAHEGRWHWNASGSGAGSLAKVIEARSGDLPAAQLAALGALTERWVRPYRVVSALTKQAAPRQPSALPGLTNRQHQVLSLLGDGLTVQAIARRLCLSPRTVGKHLERMYRRLGTSDRLTTVLRARRFGLLPGDE